MKKTWFITGSSRGLGRSLTEAVLAAGDNVVATARNTNDLTELISRYQNTLYAIKLDVNNGRDIHAAVESTIARFGRIDVLVNNAGFGITPLQKLIPKSKCAANWKRIYMHLSRLPVRYCLICVSNAQAVSYRSAQ